MKSDTETIADIVAEMRNDAAEDIAHSPNDINELAGRIEEAWERALIELREEEAKMLLREYAAAPDDTLTQSALALKRELLALAPKAGNAAAMREAISKCYQLAFEWEGNEREGLAGVEAPDSAETLFEIQSITNAAISAPVRNCDRYADAKEAILAMAGYCLHTACDTCPNRANGNGFFACIITWLFATAEGGAE